MGTDPIDRDYRPARAGGRAAVWSRVFHSRLEMAGSRSHASLAVRRGRARGPRWVAAFRPPSGDQPRRRYRYLTGFALTALKDPYFHS